MKHNYKYIVLDLETNGFSPSSWCGVTELTAIAVSDDFKHTHVVYDGLLNPGGNIPPRLVEIVGITNEMVKGKPQWQKMLKQVIQLAIAKDLIIVAHNAAFEQRFFDYAYKDSRTKWGDTGGLYIAAHPEKFPNGKYTRQPKQPDGSKGRGWKLVDVCYNYGIVFDTSLAHRARYDTERTIEVLRAIDAPIDTIVPNYIAFSTPKTKKGGK